MKLFFNFRRELAKKIFPEVFDWNKWQGYTITDLSNLLWKFAPTVYNYYLNGKDENNNA